MRLRSCHTLYRQQRSEVDRVRWFIYEPSFVSLKHEKLIVLLSLFNPERMGQLSNPIIEKQQVNEIIRIEKANFRHDFSVKCVVRYTDDIQNLLAFKMVKTFCDENNVVFSAREYDADKYNEDRNLIKSLPAFHMYARNGVDHWAIFYPKDGPVQKIQEEIAAWRRDEERKLAKKSAWNKKVQSLISFFENFSFRSKPVLKDPPRPRPKPKAAAVPIEL